MASRVALPVALLALALAGAGAVAWWSAQRAGGDSGDYPLVVAAGTRELFNGSVEAPNATALSALLASGLDVGLERYPGMGSYVVAIEGERADAAGGWVYEVLRDGAWLSGDRSADSFALQKGDALRWSWAAP